MAAMTPLLGFALLFFELFVLFVSSQAMGFAVVMAEVVLSVLVGLSLMRFAGKTAFQPAQLIGVFLHGLGSRFTMKEPVQQLLFGSLLLIIPGFSTDILGLVFIARYFFSRGTTSQSREGSKSIDIEFDVRDDKKSE